MILEEPPHRIKEPPAFQNPSELEAILQKRRDDFRDNDDNSAPSSQAPAFASESKGATAPSTSTLSQLLITEAEAEDLVNLSNLPKLLSSKFQQTGVSYDPEEGPDIWRVASVDINLGAYGIVYPDLPDPIMVEKQELIDLLTSSERMD
jgi:hypothetical protein